MINRYPLIEFGVTSENALQYCYDKGYSWGGLYEQFKRVSCFCCPMAKVGYFKTLRKSYPVLWDMMLRMDDSIIDNRGFKSYKTVRDYDNQFALADKQITLGL